MRSTENLGLLFIDDEIDLLQGINRAVRMRRPSWRLFFAASPLDAFRVLKLDSENIDVVVCDIELPYMSGIKILKVVQSDFPGIVRMTLSGRLNGASLLGARKYSECHICKPVTVDHLCEKIVATHANRHAQQQGTR